MSTDDMADPNYEQLIWERCARLFLMNTPEQLSELLDIIEKIFTNIINDPTNEKFRSVKSSNNTIKRKILDVVGGPDFLSSVGFICKTDMESANLTGKVYSLAVSESSEIQAAMIDSSLDWLKKNIETCISVAKCKAKDENSKKVALQQGTCAECVIQLRLPTGKTVCGGFMQTDTLANVRSFAGSFFTQDKYRDVNLVLPHSTSMLDESNDDLSLAQLDMCPRSSLVASAKTQKMAQESFQSKREQVMVDHAGLKRKAAHDRDKKIAEKQQLADERKQVLLAFKGDRHKGY